MVFYTPVNIQEKMVCGNNGVAIHCVCKLLLNMRIIVVMVPAFGLTRLCSVLGE